MNDDLIEKLIVAALAEAANQNVAITVAIVDLGGHLIALRRMNGCSFFAVEASRKKAVTASQLKAPTHVLSEIGQKMPELQQAFQANHEILTLPGGLPIHKAGEIVGGLGIAGGDFNQDKSVAEKTIQILNK